MPGYDDVLADVVLEHRGELERDLAVERANRDRLAADLESVNRRIRLLSSLLDVRVTSGGAGDDDDPGVARMSLHDAMREVLRTAPERMMRARDLAAEIERRGLYRMRDGRPVEPQQIHARAGNYTELFGKQGTFITLK